MKEGDKVRVTDYSGGQLNGLEGEITKIDEAEDLKYPYRIEVWRPVSKEDYKVVDGQVFQRAAYPMREGEFEVIEEVTG